MGPPLGEVPITSVAKYNRALAPCQTLFSALHMIKFLSLKSLLGRTIDLMLQMRKQVQKG